MLSKAESLSKILECGCNIGRNLDFIDAMLPAAKKSIIEISKPAYDFVKNRHSLHEGFNGPISNLSLTDKYDLVFSRGVRIHIHPDNLLECVRVIVAY